MSKKYPGHLQLVSIVRHDGKLRRAKYDAYNHVYWYDDCTHPAQNALYPAEYVVSWDPLDETVTGVIAEAVEIIERALEKSNGKEVTK